MRGLGAFGAAVVASPCLLPGVLLSSSKTSKSIIFPALPSAPRASAQHKINLVYSSTRNSRLSFPGWKETNFLLKHFPLDLLFSPRRKLRSGSRCCAVAAVLLMLRGQHGPRVPPGLAPDLPAGAPACPLLPRETLADLGRQRLHFPLGPIIF